MDSDHQLENEELRSLLKRWQVTESLPPRFEEQVWLRISRAERQRGTPSFSAVWRWCGERLARPAFAVAYISLLLVLGVTTGALQGRAEGRQNSAALREQYFRMLEPFQPPN